MQMASLKVKILTEFRTKRFSDGSVKYSCTAVSSDSQMAIIYVNDRSVQEKLQQNDFYILKGFKVNPRGHMVFVDFFEGAKVSYLCR